MCERYPERPPVGDCKGWLAHNSQLCDCYEADRMRRVRKVTWADGRSVEYDICPSRLSSRLSRVALIVAVLGFAFGYFVGRFG